MMTSKQAVRNEAADNRVRCQKRARDRGLFASRAALGFNAGDTNLYRYVGDDPTDEMDPSGEQPAQQAWPVVIPKEGKLQFNPLKKLDGVVFLELINQANPKDVAAMRPTIKDNIVSFPFVTEKDGEFRLQNGGPFFTLGVFSLAYGVQSSASFTPDKGNDSKDYYWVQYRNNELIATLDGKEKTLVTAKWFVDGFDLKDPKRPNAYPKQGEFEDLPQYRWTDQFSDAKKISIARNMCVATITLARTRNDYIDFLMKSAKEVNASVDFKAKYQLYLVKNGKPLGYVEYGFEYKGSANQNSVIASEGKWHKGFDAAVWGVATYPPPP